MTGRAGWLRRRRGGEGRTSSGLLRGGRRPDWGRRRSGLDQGVVDQSGVADPRGDGDEHAAVDGRRRAGRCRGRRARGTRARRRGRPSRPGAASRRRRGVALAARRSRPRRRAARARARPRARARRAARRTLRLDSASPSGSRTVGTISSADGHVEVGDHPPQDRDLLGVLLAEVRDVGRDDVEQLGHDGADAGEVAGPALGALEHVARGPSTRTRGREARRVDLVGAGANSTSTPSSSASAASRASSRG